MLAGKPDNLAVELVNFGWLAVFDVGNHGWIRILAQAIANTCEVPGQ